MKTNNLKEYWNMFDHYVSKSLERDSNTDLIYNIEHNVRHKRCLVLAYRISSRIDELILAGLQDRAINYSDLGLKYVDKAAEYNDVRTSQGKLDVQLANYLYEILRYKFKWMFNKKEDIELLKSARNYLMAYIENMTDNGKKASVSQTIECVNVSIKIGDFLSANQLIKKIKNKKTTSQHVDIVSDEIRFLRLILKGLLQQKTDNKIINIIIEHFKIFFYQVTTDIGMVRAYNISHLIDMSYIYSKYFDQKNILDPINVVLRIRHGI